MDLKFDEKGSNKRLENFHFENSIGRFVNALMFGLLQGSTMGCLLSLLVTLLITAVFSKYMPGGGVPYLWPLLFLLILGWLVIPALKNWIWSLDLDDEKLSMQAITGKTDSILRDDITETILEHGKVKLKSSSQILTIHPKSLTGKEQIVFKSLLVNWLPITALPIEWQEARSNLPKLSETESITYTAEWKSITPQSIQVDEIGVHHTKGKQQQTLIWAEIEAASLKFYRNQFSFWVEGQRVQIRYRKLQEEQLNKLAHALHVQLTKHKIPYEVKLPA